VEAKRDADEGWLGDEGLWLRPSLTAICAHALVTFPSSTTQMTRNAPPEFWAYALAFKVKSW